MAIATLTSNESGANSLININANFADLDTTKADLASPTFTGTPVLPSGTTGVTQSASDNSTKLATTAYVDTAIAANGKVNMSTSTAFATASAPTSWTDLNLSSIVGTAARIVMLQVNNENSGSDIVYAFRTNGETREFLGTTIYSTTNLGVSAVHVNTDKSAIVMVKTDSSGIIEWICNNAYSTSIKVLAYW